MTVYTLDSQLNFGKHKGKTVRAVAGSDDVRYLEWALENIPWFELDKDASEYVHEMLVAFELDRADEESVTGFNWLDYGDN